MITESFKIWWELVQRGDFWLFLGFLVVVTGAWSYYRRQLGLWRQARHRR